MKASKYIRNSLLTGVCVGLMTGCSWLEDWPPQGSELARKSAPKPPESKIVETSGGTWLGGGSETETPPADMADAKGIAVDGASAGRIAQLENQVTQLSNDIKMIMPALTKMAAVQSGQAHSFKPQMTLADNTQSQNTLAQNALNTVEPAAGQTMQGTGQNGVPNPAPVRMNGNMIQTNTAAQNNMAGGMANNTSGPAPGTVAWYEEQERLQREARQAADQQRIRTASVQNMAQNTAWQQQPPMQQAAMNQQPTMPHHNQQQPYYQQQQAAYQPPAAIQPPPQQMQPVQQYSANYYTPPPQQAHNPMQQASYGGGSAVTNVRFGEHPDKTRLVFDTSNKVSFSYDIDNNERILMLNLPGVSWQGAQQMQVRNSPFVAAYNVIPDNQGGHQVAIQLKRSARVLWAQALEPGGPQGHRIVLDLGAL